MINCIVIDDEPLAVRLLSNYVEKHEALSLVKSFNDPIKALHELDNLDVDLIFLDIQMPQLTGIQFLKILDNKCPVILSTAYEEYAVESYDYQVVDYLVKPISFSRFSQAIGKFTSFQTNNYHNAENKSRTNKSNDSIFIKSGLKLIRLDLNDVNYLESKGDYLYLYCKEESYKTLENLKDILPRLTSNFIRCHRSFIINQDKINFIENNRIVIGENYIPISRAYQKEVLERLK